MDRAARRGAQSAAMKATIAAVLAMAALGARAEAYPSPSFDCANTTTAQELAICRSPELSALDGRHGYLAALAIRTSPNIEATRGEVDAWLRDVRNACQTDACLVEAYTARIGALERETAAPAVQASSTFPQPRAAAGPAPRPSSSSASAPSVNAPTPSRGPARASEDEDWPWGMIAIEIAALAAALAFLLRRLSK